MINVEAFYDQDCLVELDDKRFESIWHVNRRREAYVTTYISGSGEYNLKLAVFYMKHLKNTGRSYDPFFIDKKDVLLFRAHKRSVESHQIFNIDDLIFNNRMMEKELNRVWELLDGYLCTVQYDSDIVKTMLFGRGILVEIKISVLWICKWLTMWWNSVMV